MASSKATTVQQYLDELPPERRTVISQVRDLVNRHLPTGYMETMNWGMISWEIPLLRYPDTYNKQPLSFAALAAQKSHYALYLNSVYAGSDQEASLRAAYAAAAKPLDMGKSCLRFKRMDELLQVAVAEAIASVTVDQYIAQYEASRSGR